MGSADKDRGFSRLHGLKIASSRPSVVRALRHVLSHKARSGVLNTLCRIAGKLLWESMFPRTVHEIPVPSKQGELESQTDLLTQSLTAEPTSVGARTNIGQGHRLPAARLSILLHGAYFTRSKVAKAMLSRVHWRNERPDRTTAPSRRKRRYRAT